MEEEKGEANVPTLPLEELVSKIRSVSSGADLDDAVTSIKPGMSNCDGRRKLKRAIEQVLKKSEIESTMNAKIRRKVSRAVKFLQQGNTNPKQAEEDEKKKNEANSTNQKKQDNQITKKINQVQHVPQIIFIGQLPFQASAEDVQQFLQSKVALQGTPKVRLLTKKGTNESRGMAFVELSSPADLSACLTLHKALFRGRAINVEKSCGGKNKDARQERLKELREEQTEYIRKAVTDILEAYSKQGVINLRKMGKEFQEKLISRGPEIVGTALKAFTKLHEGERTYQRLDQLLSEVVQPSDISSVENSSESDNQNTTD